MSLKAIALLLALFFLASCTKYGAPPTPSRQPDVRQDEHIPIPMDKKGDVGNPSKNMVPQ